MSVEYEDKIRELARRYAEASAAVDDLTTEHEDARHRLEDARRMQSIIQKELCEIVGQNIQERNILINGKVVSVRWRSLDQGGPRVLLLDVM